MKAWWTTLLGEQQRSHFADVSGARASLRLPAGEALLNRMIADRLPRTGRVRSLQIHDLNDDRLAVRLRLSGPIPLPILEVRLQIHEQPRLPEDAVLVLRMERTGLNMIAANALRFFDAMPEAIAVQGDLIRIDLRALAMRYGAGTLLDYLTGLSIHTEAGRVVVAAEAAVPPASSTA